LRKPFLRRKPFLKRRKWPQFVIKDVVALLSLIRRLEFDGVTVIYRGQSFDWPLIPELGRGAFLNQGMHYDHWSSLEDDLLATYKKYSHPFITSEPKSDWDWLFSARHHGLPTRLLDWSRTPLKGLYFAVHNFHHDDRDAVLWIVDFAGWSESLDHEERKRIRDLFLVFPGHIHPRIIAQDGCFTVFPLPKPHAPFESAEKARLVKRAVKVILPAADRWRLRAELAELGISHRTMFPGLDGVVASIRHEMGEGFPP
jgi:hypothetical protein